MNLLKNLKIPLLWICLMMLTSPSFSNGQGNDSLSIVPTKNIIRANQAYFSMYYQIEVLEDIVKKQDEENQRLTLAYNHRTEEAHDLSNAVNTFGYKVTALEGIIKQKDKVIKIVGTIATTAIAYSIYQTFKREKTSTYNSHVGVRVSF